MSKYLEQIIHKIASLQQKDTEFLTFNDEIYLKFAPLLVDELKEIQFSIKDKKSWTHKFFKFSEMYQIVYNSPENLLATIISVLLELKTKSGIFVVEHPFDSLCFDGYKFSEFVSLKKGCDHLSITLFSCTSEASSTTCCGA